MSSTVPFVAVDSSNLPTYKEMADCMLFIAQSMMTIRQNLLEIESAHQQRHHQEEKRTHFESINQINTIDTLAKGLQAESGSPSPLHLPSTEIDPGNLVALTMRSLQSPRMTLSPPDIRPTFEDPLTIAEQSSPSNTRPPNSPTISQSSTNQTAHDVEGLGSPTAEEIVANISHYLEDNKEIASHACDQCGKRFTNKFLLKKHKFTHTGAQPYKCDLCNKSKDNMVRHRKTPHPQVKPSQLLSSMIPAGTADFNDTSPKTADITPEMEQLVAMVLAASHQPKGSISSQLLEVLPGTAESPTPSGESATDEPQKTPVEVSLAPMTIFE